MLDYIRPMTVFAKVAEHGSFRAGAAALNVSPSVASHHISALEEHVGTALLYRSTRKLALTPAGERLLDSIRPLLFAAEQAIDELASGGSVVAGPLRVTMPTPVACGPVAALLVAFATANPGVQLTANIADGQQDLVGEGFDVVLRMGWHEPGAMDSRLLYTAECVIVASPAYLASVATPLRPADLADWAWVHHSAGPRMVTLRHPVHGAETTGGAMGIVTNAAVGVLELVAAGGGVAKLPMSVAAGAIADGRLVAMFPDWVPPRADVRAFWPASAPRLALSRRLVDFLVERIVPRPEDAMIAAE